jgi:hypothetical protein
MAVSSCGLGAPRPRRRRALALAPALLGLSALGVLGWRAAQACKPRVKALAPARSLATFAFTWQLNEEFAASAASGH